MPAPLSSDLRRRLHEAALTQSAAAVAERFGVSRRTVHRLRTLARLSGTTEPRPHGGGRAPQLTDTDKSFFEACLAENVSMTHQAMAERFNAATGSAVTRQTVQFYLRRWGITRKKSDGEPSNDTETT